MPNLASRNQSGHLYVDSDSHVGLKGPAAIRREGCRAKSGSEPARRAAARPAVAVAERCRKTRREDRLFIAANHSCYVTQERDLVRSGRVLGNDQKSLCGW